jgi:hypothetical protein
MRSLRQAGALLLVATVTGAASPSGTTPPDSAAPRPVMGIVAVPRGGPQRLEARAVADTPWTVERPRPRATYGSFAKASEFVETTLRGLFGSYADSASWERRDTSFVYRDQPVLHRPAKTPAYWSIEDRDAPLRLPALIVTLDMARDGGPDVTGIAGALEAAGWDEDGVYSADGTDGTRFAYVCREALCVVRGEWDGGDPTDSTYVPQPGGSIELLCVPRLAEPGPRTAR